MRLLASLSFWLSLICLLALLLGWIGPVFGWWSEPASLGFFLVSYLAGGFYGVKKGFEELLERKLSVDLLMVVAAIGAASIGQWLEGAILLFLFSLSNALQDFALEKSNRAIEALMQLRPDTARIRDANGEVRTVPVDEVGVGDIVLVRPGERFAIDGVVLEGTTAADQSAITGESIPVEKSPGDEIFGGTMNTSGAIAFRASRPVTESTLARIVELVQRARAGKAKTQRILDQFEPRYAGMVLLATAALIAVPWLLQLEPFDRSFYRAMTILVVASPCALVISTPATILSAIAHAARKGVLFKGGAYLEQTASLKYVAMDKTGTLTKGKPEVTDLVPCQGSDDRELLLWAASAENMSEHPLAAAVVRKAVAAGLELRAVDNLQAVTGKGVVVAIGPDEVRVGSRRLMSEAGIGIPEESMEKAQFLEDQGKTVIFAAVGLRFIGLIALADVVKPEAKAAVNALKEQGVHILMLTGDSSRVAKAVAAQLDITDVHAELLPGSKEVIVRELAAKGPVAMVGDGVNDAPALASGNLGVAMGGAGSDVALETADVVLMSDDLTRLPWMIRLSRRARRVVWQNIVFSLAVIVVLCVSVFAIDLPLPLGVVGHEGSTLLVVANGLRLLAGGVD